MKNQVFREVDEVGFEPTSSRVSDGRYTPAELLVETGQVGIEPTRSRWLTATRSAIELQALECAWRASNPHRPE